MSLTPWRGREGDGASKTSRLLPAPELESPPVSPSSEEEEEEDMRRVYKKMNSTRRRRRNGERMVGGERKQRTKSVDKDTLLRGGGPRLWRYVFFFLYTIFFFSCNFVCRKNFKYIKVGSHW